MSKWRFVSDAERYACSDALRAELEGVAGVYAVYGDGLLLYIGLAANLWSRVSYKGHHGAARERLPKRIRGRLYRKIEWKVRPERFFGERATLEMRLLRRLSPPHNRVLYSGKMEKPHRTLSSTFHRPVTSTVVTSCCV